MEYEEINSYLYLFEVQQTQQISFDVRLNIITGDSDLYLKHC